MKRTGVFSVMLLCLMLSNINVRLAHAADPLLGDLNAIADRHIISRPTTATDTSPFLVQHPAIRRMFAVRQISGYAFESLGNTGSAPSAVFRCTTIKHCYEIRDYTNVTYPGRASAVILSETEKVIYVSTKQFINAQDTFADLLYNY